MQVVAAEILGQTRHRWSQLEQKDRDRVLGLPFVTRVVGAKVYFRPGTEQDDTEKDLESELRRLTGGKCELRYIKAPESPEDKFRQLFYSRERFAAISFGSDVAEHDEALLNYFVTTDSFRRMRNREKSIVVGPKGSGKSALLRALNSNLSPGYGIVITPEVFATSVLRQFIDQTRNVWDEDEAFVATWIYTILVEVFKRVCDNPRGIPPRSLKPIREFLRDQTTYAETDLFSRFVSYLKQIQGVKIGDHEVTIKTRLLHELYALEKLYALVPILRACLKDDIVILIDELDQGWDNTEHSNRFLASLLTAAIKVRSMATRLHVVAFVRSEIFDLVKYRLDQLDKIRSSIEIAQWSTAQLAAVVLRRIAYSINFKEDVEKFGEVIDDVFPERCRDIQGFDYVTSRTTMRPREVLQFVRRAYELSPGQMRVGILAGAILRAEEDFSQWKFEHLCAEYKHIYPNLKEFLECFRERGPLLPAKDATSIVEDFAAQALSTESFPAWTRTTIQDLFKILYGIEFLGIKKASTSSGRRGIVDHYEFAYQRPSPNLKMVRDFIIHPAFWRALEISSM